MSHFPIHTQDTVPEASTPYLEKAEKAFGFVPNLQKVFATSPALLEGYMTLWDIFAKSSFSPEEQQVVYLTVNYENRCYYCMAGHSGIAQMVGLSDAVIKALRDGNPIPDPKLQALRLFTEKMVQQRGFVADGDVEDFLSAGYDSQSVLDLILGISVKVMSNYTNHLAHTPIDDVMSANAWTHPDDRAAAE